MNVTLGGYLELLLLTLVIETPLVALLLWRVCGWKRALAAGVLASATTHPLLCFAWPLVVPFTRETYLAFVVSGESLVVVIEAVIIYLALRQRHGARPSRPKREAVAALAISLGANVTSFGIGMLTW
jgi:hypothetical protein